MARTTNGTMSIQDVSRLAGTTSRTLRHYDTIGLLPAATVDHAGMRWYDQASIRRLQRILLLRDLGLGLGTIASVLDRDTSPVEALEEHLRWLDEERDLLERRTASVGRTVIALKEGRDLMAEEMMDGFDHTRYRDEVEQTRGKDAYASGDAWWRAKSPAERARSAGDQKALAGDWAAAAAAGTDPRSSAAQELAARHVAWLGSIPGTPGVGGEPDLAYVVGLGEMYVTDDRFAANHGGAHGARLVLDALRAWADARR